MATALGSRDGLDGLDGFCRFLYVWIALCILRACLCLVDSHLWGSWLMHGESVVAAALDDSPFPLVGRVSNCGIPGGTEEVKAVRARDGMVSCLALCCVCVCVRCRCIRCV